MAPININVMFNCYMILLGITQGVEQLHSTTIASSDSAGHDGSMRDSAQFTTLVADQDTHDDDIDNGFQPQVQNDPHTTEQAMPVMYEDSADMSNSTDDSYYLDVCPSMVECSKLGGDCIRCNIGTEPNCLYGSNFNATCTPKKDINCTGAILFEREFQCRYCYQTSKHHCTHSTSCHSVAAPQQWYTANCTVPENVMCLGRRRFYKRVKCNWTSGYRWSTALALSVTLGGFGIDRFYLGLWKEGIGKFFSFGGLGVWTIVDVVLIATGYVGPADGSLYIF